MSEQLRNFDKEAASWDSAPRVKLSKDVAAAIAKHVPLREDMNVLDYGCGTGTLALALRPLVRSVTGADTSSGMLEVYKEKIHRDGVARMRVLRLDPASEKPLPGVYHLVVSNMTLHHVKETGALLSKFSGALLPGGFLAVTDLDPEGGLFHDSHDGVFHHGFDRGVLRGLFAEAGFEDIQDHPGATMSKPGRDGKTRKFTIFLMTGRKKVS